MRKPNELIILCKITIILTKNGPVCIDTADIPLIQVYYWNIDKSSGYCVTHIKGRKEYLHRLIVKTPPRLQTDHIDGCKTNNRRINLRIADASLNQLNRHKANRNSASQELGVSWRQRLQKWEACLVFRKKYYYLGLFELKEQAAKTRADKVKELMAMDPPDFLNQADLDTLQIISIERVSDLPAASLPEIPPLNLNIHSINF